MFFLGAGFMLLETKGVVHMALLFGSTWVVNSIVFFAILVMILLSNLFVLAFRPQRLWPYYVLLIVALVVNMVVPMVASPATDADPTPNEVLAKVIPVGRIGDPEKDIGRPIAFLAGEDSAFITGSTVMLDGGLTYLR